ncbi:MAG: LuxR C-terminal-related transcriptional regulator [Thermocrispum sp.]
MDRPVTRGAVDTAVAAATREVVVGSSVIASGAPLAMPRRIDLDNLRRGVRYRLLYPDRSRVAPVLARQLGRLALLGAEVRTMPSVPIDALVIDAALAVLPREARVEGPCALAYFQLPSVVATTLELFELVWSAAVPLCSAELPEIPTGCDVTERERELLTLLSAGCTDRTVAARLGVSVRTVRRMMSEMMNRLGARSRFQAGAKAADRGWLEQRAG